MAAAGLPPGRVERGRLHRRRRARRRPGGCSTRDRSRRPRSSTPTTVMALSRGSRCAAELGSGSRTTCRSPASTTPTSPGYVHPALTTVRADAFAAGARRRRARCSPSIDGESTQRRRHRTATRASWSCADPPRPPDTPLQPVRRRNEAHPDRRCWPSSRSLLTACNADSGGGGGDADEPRASTRPDHHLVLEQRRGSRLGQADGRGLERRAPGPEGHRAGDPGRQDLRGGHRRRDHRRHRAVPDLQHLAGRGAAVPEAGRSGRRWTTSPTARATSRSAPATAPSSTSRRTASTTSCRGSRTR